MVNVLKKQRRQLLPAAAVLLAAAAVAGILVLRPARASESGTEEQARLVEVRRIEYAPAELSLSKGGFITPARRLTVRAMVEGEVVESLGELKSGTRVTDGEPLVRIDDEAVRNRVALTRVELIQSTAALISSLGGEAKESVERWRLFFSRLSTEGDAIPELPAAMGEREKLLAGTLGVLEAYYNLRDGEANLARHRIDAPFSGVLEGDGAARGSYATPGSVLFTITDAVNLEIAVSLTASDLETLGGESSAVRLLASDGSEGPAGVVLRRDGVMERESQSVTLHIGFTNETGDPRFLPGGYAVAVFSGRIIPEGLEIDRGLLNGDGTVNCYRDGRLVRRPVEILARRGDSVILAPGLDAGDELITTRLQAAYPGMALRKAEAE